MDRGAKIKEMLDFAKNMRINRDYRNLGDLELKKDLSIKSESYFIEFMNTISEDIFESMSTTWLDRCRKGSSLKYRFLLKAVNKIFTKPLSMIIVYFSPNCIEFYYEHSCREVNPNRCIFKSVKDFLDNSDFYKEMNNYLYI